MSEPRLFQVAAGDRNRNYSELCIEHDLMLIGPGTPGHVEEGAYRGGTGTSEYGQINAFASEPRGGDLVLLRVAHEVVAIGQIPSGDGAGYGWSYDFDDVLGWDLQHYRRVQWEPSLIGDFPAVKSVFATRKQTPTFTRVHQVSANEVGAMAARLVPRALRPLPDAGEILTKEELGVALFSAGVGHDAIDGVIAALTRVARLARWYRQDEAAGRPTEHEVVAHVVVPLLRGLGWSEQFVAVEWNKVDVAIFDKTPTNEGNCIAVIEAKGAGQPLMAAYGQAKEYVTRLKLTRCRLIGTADETRLFTHARQPDGAWPDAPTGYLNCSAVRARHLVPKGTNSVATLVGLLPGRL